MERIMKVAMKLSLSTIIISFLLMPFAMSMEQDKGGKGGKDIGEEASECWQNMGRLRHCVYSLPGTKGYVSSGAQAICKYKLERCEKVLSGSSEWKNKLFTPPKDRSTPKNNE